MVQLLPLILVLCSFSQMPPENVFYHPVSTTSCEAQEAFNCGLISLYGFNYDEAYNQFKKASISDPELGMAYWGMAISLEENSKHKEAEEMIQTALTHMQGASDNEKGYIEAFARRYCKSEDENKHTAYREAMRALAEKYPDDPDASVLYAESLMNLLAWHPWKSDKSPKNEMTTEVINVLTEVLKKAPDHPGGNHYFIHAIEDSKHPERGFEAARRLEAFTEFGHLLHSSSHIYLRMGDYERAVVANLKACAADENYTDLTKYLKKYFTHTLFFLTRSYMWQEREKESVETAKKLQRFVESFDEESHMADNNLLTLLEVYLYFHCWEEIANYPKPEREGLLLAFWHFAQSKRLLKMGEMEKAKEHRQEFLREKEKLKDDKTLDLAACELGVAFNQEGKKTEECETLLRECIEKEDELGFLGWYHQNRQTLGALLLKQGRADEAECVFRESLALLPRNGRSLFGLHQAQAAQNKFDYWAEREAKNALKYSEGRLTLDDLE